MGRLDGLTDGQGGDFMHPRNFSGSIKSITMIAEQYLKHQHITINQSLSESDALNSFESQ